MSNIKQSEEWLACKAMLRMQGFVQHEDHWVMFVSKKDRSRIMYSPGKKIWIAKWNHRHLQETLMEIINGKK